MKKKNELQQFNTITELLQKSSEKYSENTLFVQMGKPDKERIDYARWGKDLLAMAGRFQKLEGKHIGIVCDLTYDCILCMYAVMLAGKVVVPLAADLSAEVLEKYVEKVDIDLLLYNENRVEGTVKNCRMLLIPETYYLPGEPLQEWPEWEENRTAGIFLTSGTEGEPRGVVLSQKNMAIVNSYRSVHIYERNPRILIFLPTHHIYSFTTLTTCISECDEMYLSRSIKYVAQEMEEIRPDALTTVQMVNELFQSRINKGIDESGKRKQLERLIAFSNGLRRLGIDLRNPIFKKLRDGLGGIPQLIITGGSAVPEETVQFFDDIGIIVIQAYGLTEASGFVSANTIETNRKGTVGQANKFSRVRIVEGEIQVQGDNVMQGYYKQPEETARVLEDGWLKTGDLGYLDKDGYLHITGRKKNLIILNNGENVSPEELENELLKSIYICEVVVCEQKGHIHAQVYANQALEIEEENLRSKIGDCIKELNSINPVYKRIATWELRKEPFEKTGTMKIRR
ncbi:MAG: AMP-binding protein [Lachnospiraceae bacterium]|nr:AMP-binding protein [Lachnospiraceae bacterium]